MTNVAERRSHPRASISIDFNLKGEDHLLSASTQNVSAKGLSCVLGHHVPLFTKLEICMMVPDPNDQTHEEMSAIHTQGVVVRVDEDGSSDPPQYRTAVFFTHIDPDGAKMLQEYVKAHQNS